MLTSQQATCCFLTLVQLRVSQLHIVLSHFEFCPNNFVVLLELAGRRNKGNGTVIGENDSILAVKLWRNGANPVWLIRCAATIHKIKWRRPA